MQLSGFPPIRLGVRAVSLGDGVKETSGISSQLCRCQELCGTAEVGEPTAPGYSKAPRPMKTIQPALSHMPGGHRGLQESERKWKRATLGLKAMCSPPGKKNKNKHTQK